MLFLSQVFLATTSVFHGLLSMNVGASKIVLSRLNVEMVKVIHLPLSRDSRNELQFCSLLKYSLLKLPDYYISEK